MNSIYSQPSTIFNAPSTVGVLSSKGSNGLIKNLNSVASGVGSVVAPVGAIAGAVGVISTLLGLGARSKYTKALEVELQNKITATGYNGDLSTSNSLLKQIYARIGDNPAEPFWKAKAKTIEDDLTSRGYKVGQTLTQNNAIKAGQSTYPVYQGNLGTVVDQVLTPQNSSPLDIFNAQPGTTPKQTNLIWYALGGFLLYKILK